MALANSRWVRVAVAVLVLAASLYLMSYVRRQYERYRGKVTLTHIAQVGQIYQKHKGSDVNCAAIVRRENPGLGSDVCYDGWGNPLVINTTHASNGSESCSISAKGSATESLEPQFVWRDGQWEKVPTKDVQLISGRP